MKKVLVILLALSMLFSLAACGGSKETEPAKTDAPAAQSGGKTESGKAIVRIPALSWNVIRFVKE